MIPWLRGFLFNETAFVGLVRLVLLSSGGTIVAYPDVVGDLPKWAGVALMGAAGFVRAGEKNPPKGDA